MFSDRVNFKRFTRSTKMTSAIKFFVLVLVWVAVMSCARADPNVIRNQKKTPVPRIRHDHQLAKLKNISGDATNIISRMNNALTILDKGEGNDLSVMQMCKGHKLLSGVKKSPHKRPKSGSSKSTNAMKELFELFDATMNEIRKSQNDFDQRFFNLSKLVIKSNRGRFNQTERRILTTRMANYARSLSDDIKSVLKNPPKWIRNENLEKKYLNDTRAQVLDCYALKEWKICLKSSLPKIKFILKKANELLKKRKTFLMRSRDSAAAKNKQ